ncbi:MAG: Hpt domain-containing protein [Candidatus Limnocylindria bacterium]
MPDVEPPVLDEAILAELRATTGDDDGFVRELVETYLADVPAQLEAIATAIEAGDAASLVRPAHTLKSSSATVGALRLAAIARRLEMAGRAGELDATTAADVQTVRAECEAASEALTAWLARETRA